MIFFHAGIGLKRTYEALGIEPSELARKVGVTRQNVYIYTQRENMSTTTIVKCALALGVAPSEIIKNGEVLRMVKS